MDNRAMVICRATTSIQKTTLTCSLLGMHSGPHYDENVDLAFTSVTTSGSRFEVVPAIAEPTPPADATAQLRTDPWADRADLR